MDHVTNLRRLAHAGKGADPRLYRMHRHVSIHLTRVLLRTSIPADAVTIAMMILAGAGALLLAAPGAVAIAAGAALLYLGFLLDKVDGELARCRGTASVRGIFLDRLHHRLVEPMLFAAAAAHAWRREADPRVLLAAAACMLFANAIEENQQLAPYILYKHLREGGSLPHEPAATQRMERLARWLRPLKALRMHIVMLPLVLLAYLLEVATGLPATRLYLVSCAFGLGLYLVFQAVDYAAARLQRETREVAVAFARASAREPAAWRVVTEPAANSAPTRARSRSSESPQPWSREA